MTIENNKDLRNSQSSAGLNNLVSVYNRFAFRLFNDIISSQAPAIFEKGENIFFSPFSIATDLAMLYNSKSEEISQAAAKILEYKEIYKSEFNQANAALKPLLEDNSQLSVDNFCSRDIKVSDNEFEEINRNFYYTDIENMSGDPYGDTATVNGWISGKIKYLSAVLSDIHPDAICFILNTLFFKRDWKQNPLQPIPVLYYHGKDFQVISVPYKDEEKRIYFILPDNLTDFLQNRLNYEEWQKWREELSVTEGEIHLPNINIECETDMENFFDIPDIHLYHRGFLKISSRSCKEPENKAGTEPGNAEFRFNFSSPFLCMIQDEITGMILFTGYIADPLSEKKITDKSGICISDKADYPETGLVLNSDRSISYSTTDELDLDVDKIIESGGISVDSNLPEHISEEIMNSIEAEIDNNLRELYQVYKNGETEPSDCIAGACTCIIINNKKSQEDDTGLDEINLEGLELDLPNIHDNVKPSDYKEKDNPFTYLVKHHLLTSDDLKKAEESREPAEKYLEEHFKIPKKDILASFGAYYGLRCMEYEKNIRLNPEFAALSQSGSGWVPLFRTEDKIIIATDSPDNEQMLKDIKSLFPHENIEFRVAFRDDISKFIRHFRYIKEGRIFGGKKDEDEDTFNINEIKKELKTGLKEWELPVTRDVLDLVSQIIRDAYFQNVTDIYIEQTHSEDRGVAVQGRIDGICRDYPFFIPGIFGYPVVNCIKKMAGLNTAERSISQSGKIRLKTEDENVILQAVTYPTHEVTEDAALTFLRSSDPVPLYDIGFSKRDHQVFLDNINKDHGLILITGRDSSATFHSALNHLDRPEKKIFTAEYNPEFIHHNIRQIRLNPEAGFDMSAAVQSILQANPDVIGVNMGIWDNRIVQKSVEAALGNHLVLLKSDSSLDASSLISRITDTGIDIFSFADSLLCLVSQHTVAALCKYCKESYTPSKREFDELVSHYGKDDFEKEPPDDINGNPVKDSKDLLLYRRKHGGCSVCNGTGYYGKTGVYELFAVTDEIKRLIIKKGTAEDIQNQAVRNGMKRFLQDGIAKIFAGYTDWHQIRKIND